MTSKGPQGQVTVFRCDSDSDWCWDLWRPQHRVTVTSLYTPRLNHMWLPWQHETSSQESFSWLGEHLPKVSNNYHSLMIERLSYWTLSSHSYHGDWTTTQHQRTQSSVVCFRLTLALFRVTLQSHSSCFRFTWFVQSKDHRHTLCYWVISGQWCEGPFSIHAIAM